MRILLTSTDAIPTNDVAALLAANKVVVEHIPDVDQAMDFARTYPFDAVIVHAEAASGTAIDHLRRLRAAGNHTPALVATRRMTARDQATMLDAGADDVVTLPSDGHLLCARLRAAVRRSVGLSSSVLRVGPVELDTAGHTVTVDGKAVRLSITEFRLLELLMLRKNTVVRKTAMLDALYDSTDEHEVKSVDVMVHRLRKRLAAAGIGTFVSTIWGAGYIVRQTDQPQSAVAAMPKPVAYHTPLPLRPVTSFVPPRRVPAEFCAV